MAAYGFALRWQASGCQGTPRDTHDATFTRLGRLWGCLSSRLVGMWDFLQIRNPPVLRGLETDCLRLEREGRETSYLIWYSTYIPSQKKTQSVPSNLLYFLRAMYCTVPMSRPILSLALGSPIHARLAKMPRKNQCLNFKRCEAR